MQEHAQGNAAVGAARHRALAGGKVFLAGVLLALTGCSKTVGSFDTDDSNQTKMSNLWALVQFKPIPSQPQPFSPIKCPEISVQGRHRGPRIASTAPATTIPTPMSATSSRSSISLATARSSAINIR